eukprot:15176415-Ditylum_brightwellii.AAC.1
MATLFQPSESNPSKLKYRYGGTLLASNAILSAAHCHKKADISHVGKCHLFNPTKQHKTFEIVQKWTKLAVLGKGKDGSDGQNTAMLHEAE